MCALHGTGLEEELRNPSLKATIFAPTDDAWWNMPEPYSVSRLLTESSAEVTNELQKLLLYHVVAGRVTNADIVDSRSYVTFLGSFVSLVKGLGALTVSREEGGTYVTAQDVKAKIVRPDVGKDI